MIDIAGGTGVGIYLSTILYLFDWLLLYCVQSNTWTVIYSYVHCVIACSRFLNTRVQPCATFYCLQSVLEDIWTAIAWLQISMTPCFHHKNCIGWCWSIYSSLSTGCSPSAVSQQPPRVGFHPLHWGELRTASPHCSLVPAGQRGCCSFYCCCCWRFSTQSFFSFLRVEECVKSIVLSVL